MVSSKKKVLSAFLSLAMIGSMVAAVPLTANADATTAPAAAGVTYKVQGQTYGWQAAVSDGSLAGTVGQSKRLEALKISLTGAPTGASITYQVQGQTYGWQAAKSDGAQAGTVGQAKRLEAIKITLSGAPGYEVEYKVQGQTYGWQGWKTAENGTAIADAPIAGTVGQAKRLEALEIIVKKTDAEISAETVATAAVVKAEGSKAQADIDAATAAITSVQDAATAKYLTDRLTAINTTLAVVSATEVNADQISVVFSKPLNSTSADLTGNYSLKVANVATPITVSDATLQSDSKTVLLTLASGLVNGTGYQLSITNVLDATGATVPDYTTTFVGSDSTVPALVSATANAKTTTNTITLNFSEPVDTTSAFVLVNGSYATISGGNGTSTITLTTSSTLAAGATASLSIVNVKDFAGNSTSPNPLTASVTVGTDTVSPNVVSVTMTSDKYLEVTFDKAINPATVTAGTTVLLKDSNLSTTAGTLAYVGPTDSTDKVFDFTITGTTFPSTGVENAIVSFTSGITDTAGNTLNPILKYVSFTKDTSAPTLVSAAYANTTTYGSYNGLPYSTPYGSIVLTYSEPVTVNAANTAISVVDNNGAIVLAPAVSDLVVNGSNSNQVILKLSASIGSGLTSYLVLLPSGLVTDDSQSANTSAATNQVVSVSAGAVVSGDTTAPAIGSVLVTPDPDGATATTITYTITEAVGLNLATVVNTANYLLDGKPLPTGSYVTVSGSAPTYNVTVKVPAGSFTSDEIVAGSTGGAILVISGIKDNAGNAASTFVQNETVYADAAPVLNSAVINGNGTLSAGFSLGVSVASTVTASDLVVTVNGVNLTWVDKAADVTTAGTAGIASQYTVTDGTGADAGKYVITVYDGAGAAYSLTNATSVSIATGTVTGITTTSHIATIKAASGTSITVK